MNKRRGRLGLDIEPFDAMDERNEGRELMGRCVIPLAAKARSFPLHFYGELTPTSPMPDQEYHSLDEMGLRPGINSEPAPFLKPVIQALYDTDPEVQDRDEDGKLMHVLLHHPDHHERDIMRRDNFFAVMLGFGVDAVDEGSLEMGRSYLHARLSQLGYEGMFDHALAWFQRNAATLMTSERAHLSDDHARNSIREGTTHVRSMPKVKRNDPCVCGSGKKFKKCCGKVR